MRSLRTRIATWYALLLVAVIVALGVAIAVRFESILYGQAQARVDSTMNQIALAVAPPAQTFAIQESPGESLQVLLSSANLQNWSSPTTFVEVDTPSGYLLAHSSNMGSAHFPVATGLNGHHPKELFEAQTSRGRFLVEERLLGSGGESAIVAVGEPMDQLQRVFTQTQRAVLTILLIAIACVVLLSIALASQTVNPINELAAAMRQIGSEGLNRRLKWKNRQDEIGKLAETFDDLIARLEEAFARERQFISDASHELKTPLTSINANAQMLMRWANDDERIRHDSLQTIAKESASLAAMVGGMLTLAKADSGDAIPKQSLRLDVLAQEAVRSSASRAAEKGITLQFDPQSAPATMFGDENLMRQLAGNLIDNAIKFTDTGSVTVATRATPTNVSLEVRDTGRGIAPAELPLVFDRFYRADKARNREIPGTGLGLAIVRSIARVHGGKVSADAPPGGGTIFRAVFPAAGDDLTQD